jgi:HEAT repeat protein
MEKFMKKRLFAMFIILSISSIVFASDADKYIADLDPAKDEKTIIQAADWVGEKKEEDAAKKLVALLSDGRDMVRLHAVMALCYIAEDEYLDSLHNVVLTDKNSSVRYAAVLSVMRINKPDKSKPVFLKAKETETDPFIKDLFAKMEEKEKGK